MSSSNNSGKSGSRPFPVTDIDPYSDEFLENPYPFFEEIRSLGPLARLSKYDCLVTVDWHIATDVLSDPETYCSSAGVGLSNFHKEKPWRPPSLVLETDPPEHTRARRVLNRVLSAKAVSEMAGTFEEVAEQLVEKLLKKKSFDAVPALAEAYPLKVFPDAIGLPEEGRENLLPYGNMVFNALGPRNHLFEEAFRNAQSVQSWILEHCRRENLSPDGMGVKIHDEAAGEGMTEEEACLLVRSTLSAGVDTTVNTLGSAIYCFIRYPDQWSLLRDDPSLARNAFEEVLRFEGTAHSFYRTSTREAVIGDFTIPAGEKMLVLLAGANRDGRRWPDADRFLVTRDCRGHVGFGSGIHGCVGKALARLEGRILLTALARRVESFQLSGDPVYRLNNSLRGLASLPITINV